jgi:hypothetical protein
MGKNIFIPDVWFCAVFPELVDFGAAVAFGCQCCPVHFHVVSGLYFSVGCTVGHEYFHVSIQVLVYFDMSTRV